MSRKQQPAQYADAKGSILEGFDRNIAFAEGTTVPADATVGYSPGALFLKRAGTIGAQLYVNQGGAASCLFKPLPAAPVAAAASRSAAGVATVTGTLTVATGLTTVVAVVATMQADASLTNGTSVTATVGDQVASPVAGSVILKVWKPTASGDATPIAGAAAVLVNWIAFGV